MLPILPLILSLLLGLLGSQPLLAGSDLALVPETDRGRIVVSITAEDPAANWIASAHADHIRDILSRFPRLTIVAGESLDLGACEDFACRRQQLNRAGIDLYIEGELEGRELSLRTIVPETEVELSEETINLRTLHSPEAVKSAVLQLLRPYTEAGGVLDQRSALRRAVKGAEHLDTGSDAKRHLALSLAAVGFAIFVAILTALIVFPDGRRPLLGLGGLWLVLVLGPLWLISEDLALVKPVAIFALPEPWLLAVFGGIGCGAGLWLLGLSLVPQLRGLEFMKQERMPLLVKALSTVILYRSLVTLLGGALVFALIYAVRVIYELDAVHTVALSLVALAAWATLIALFFESCAQLLDRRLVIGRANSENEWNIRVKAALAEHPRLSGLADILARVLILPTQEDRPLTYGGGFLSAPRILIPLRALEKAFSSPVKPSEGEITEEGDENEEVQPIPYDFLWGLLIAGLGSISLRTHLDNTLSLTFGRQSPKKYRRSRPRQSSEKDLIEPYRRASQTLEGAFLALHEGLAPFVQYLFWRHKAHTELLTSAGQRRELNEVIEKIMEEISSGRFPLTIDRPRDHIIWLVQTYLRPRREQFLPEKEEGGGSKSGGRKRRLRGSKLAFALLGTAFIGYQVLSAALYHPVYEERIALEKEKIEAKKAKKENIAHVPEPQPAENLIGTELSPQPTPRPGSQEVVGSAAPGPLELFEAEKQKAVEPKPKKQLKNKTKSKFKSKSEAKPKSKLKPKGKAKLQPKSKQRSEPAGSGKPQRGKPKPKPKSNAKPKTERSER